MASRMGPSGMQRQNPFVAARQTFGAVLAISWRLAFLAPSARLAVFFCLLAFLTRKGGAHKYARGAQPIMNGAPHCFFDCIAWSRSL